jgi:Protein of unknown function (DUF4012)
MPTLPRPDVQPSDTTEPPATAPSPPRRRRGRRTLWVVGVLAVVAALGLALTFSALAVRDRLRGAQAEMRSGRAELLDGDAAAAARSFEEAGSRFGSADGGVAGLAFRFLGWVPFLGNSSRATLDVADAGASAASAGETIARAVERLPGGLTALAPSDGAIPIDQLAPLTEAAARAEADLAEAVATVDGSPGSFLIGPVAEARRTAQEELGSLHDMVRSGSLILQGLPAFLGQDAPKTYLFFAQNPAELRGTGGVLGAYSILTIADGRFSFSPFRPIESLPIPSLSDVPPPSAEYAANYDQYRGGKRFWLAINLTPDVPTAATALLNAYEVAMGERPDGVILADPFALQALLRATGPTEIPGLGTRVSAGNVVDLTANEAFSLFPGPNERKEALGAVASGVFERFVHSRPDMKDLRVLGRAVAEGHLLIYSEDPTMEEGLRGSAAGGALPGPGGDLLSVAENSAGANKLDYYQDRSVSYAVDLWPGGAGEGTATVHLANHAPTSGQPRYVIGPHPPYTSEPGESGQLVNVYCGPGCKLESAHRDGQRISVWTGTELGHRFYQDYFTTPSGGTNDLQLTWYLPQAWEGDETGGTYRLSFLNQTTIRPTSLKVEVHAPQGMRIVETSPQMHVTGDSATWEGVPNRRLELVIRFQPPLLARLWRGLTG